MTATPITFALRRDVHRRAMTRTATVTIGLSVAIVVAFCVSISVGDFPIPLRDVVPAILGVGSEDAEFIVRTLRLPRALTGVLVGVSFGISGAIFQSLARNPLASPDIIGIDAGASAAAVFCIVVLNTRRGGDRRRRARRRPPGRALAIYLLAWKRGRVAIPSGARRHRRRRAPVEHHPVPARRGPRSSRPSAPSSGSPAASTDGAGSTCAPSAWPMCVLIPMVVALLGPLRMLQLGDDAARGLGVAVERVAGWRS